MRRRAALTVITLGILAAGAVLAVTIASHHGHAMATDSASNPFGTVGTVSYPTPQQLPYDSEENAFMAGCLHQWDTQSGCDCIYRMLRSEGHPASELAALGPDLTSGASGGYGGAPTSYGPAWFGRAEGVCTANQAG